MDNKRSFVQFVFAYWQMVVVISGPELNVRFLSQLGLSFWVSSADTGEMAFFWGGDNQFLTISLEADELNV